MIGLDTNVECRALVLFVCVCVIIWRSCYGFSTSIITCTVEPLYNEVLGTMKITLLYQVSRYIRVKKQRNIKSWDQQNYLVIRGFCYIRPLYNEVSLYYIRKDFLFLFFSVAGITRIARCQQCEKIETWVWSKSNCMWKGYVHVG